MTFLWDSFVSKLRAAGTTVDAIQHCSEGVLLDLVQDLGFTALQVAQIQTEWKQRVKVVKGGARDSLSLPREVAAVTPLRQQQQPLPFHSPEFSEVAQHVLSYHVGTLKGWAVVAIDAVPARDGGERVSRPGDAVVVASVGDAELGHLLQGTTAVHTLLTVRQRWTAALQLPQMKLIVGVVNAGQALTTRTPNRVFLPAAAAAPETASPPSSGQGRRSSLGQAPEAPSSRPRSSSTATGDGQAMPLTSITGSALHASGFDTVIVEDGQGQTQEYRVRSADQIDVKYVVTVVQLNAHSQTGAGGPDPATCRYCDRHPDHPAEFWNPVEASLTCALCHLVGDAQKHPCMPLAEAAALEESAVAVWVERANAHLSAVGASKNTVLAALDALEQDYRRNVAALHTTVDTIRRELEGRRDEILASIEGQFEARRSDLRASEQTLSATTTTLTELVGTADTISTPLATMVFRQDVVAVLGATVSAPTTVHGSFHFRPVSWDAHMRFESETSEVRLQLRTREAVGLRGGEGSEAGSVVEVPGGAVHYLGSLGGRRDYSNPHASGAVAVTASQPFVCGDAAAVVSRVHQECRLKSELRAWIALDLGTSHRLVCKKYSLRHGHEQDHAALRDWAFEASNDTKEWRTLRRHKRDVSLKGPFGTASFSIDSLGDGAREAYRFFRVRILGPNNAGAAHFHIEICDVEVYGTLLTV